MGRDAGTGDVRRRTRQEGACRRGGVCGVGGGGCGSVWGRMFVVEERGGGRRGERRRGSRQKRSDDEVRGSNADVCCVCGEREEVECLCACVCTCVRAALVCC